MRQRVLLCVLLSALVFPTARAGDAPWLALRATVIPAAGFDIDEAGRLDGRVYRLAAALPEWRAGPAEVALGIDYDYTRYEYEGLDGRNRDLHRLEFPLTARLGDGDWRYSGAVAAGISASSNVFSKPLERWQRDDVTLRASLAAASPARGNWRWQVGLHWDRRFGRQLVYPAVGVLWDRGALSLQLGLPDTTLRYEHSERQVLTARLYPAGHAWHVVGDELGDDFDYRARAWRGDLTWSVRTGGRLLIDLVAGHEFARRHRLTDDEGTRFAADADGQWVIAIGLRSRGAPLP